MSSNTVRTLQETMFITFFKCQYGWATIGFIGVMTLTLSHGYFWTVSTHSEGGMVISTRHLPRTIRIEMKYNQANRLTLHPVLNIEDTARVSRFRCFPSHIHTCCVHFRDDECWWGRR